MKLVVMIPAYNEEQSIDRVIKSIPRELRGIDRVEVLVIDDGSQDHTKMFAEKAGADSVISNPANMGLAYSFNRGISQSLSMGADIVVNIDADDQYDATEIPKLLRPITHGNAGMVIGNRQVKQLNHMPLAKKYGNRIGSWILRTILGNSVADASSGFRAFSMECAMRLNIFSSHTYTHESIIQCTKQRVIIAEVPVVFSPRYGSGSRLIRGVVTHIGKSSLTIIRALMTYEPFKVFSRLALIFLLAGTILGTRYVIFMLEGSGAGHIQSVILGMTLIIIGVIIFVLALIADIIATSRIISEDILYAIKLTKHQHGRKRQ